MGDLTGCVYANCWGGLRLFHSWLWARARGTKAWRRGGGEGEEGGWRGGGSRTQRGGSWRWGQGYSRLSFRLSSSYDHNYLPHMITIIFLIWWQLSSSYDHDYLPHMITIIFLIWSRLSSSYDHTCALVDLSFMNTGYSNSFLYMLYFWFHRTRRRKKKPRKVCIFL